MAAGKGGDCGKRLGTSPRVGAHLIRETRAEKRWSSTWGEMMRRLPLALLTALYLVLVGDAPRRARSVSPATGRPGS